MFKSLHIPWNKGKTISKLSIKKRTETRRKNGWFKNMVEFKRKTSERMKGKKYALGRKSTKEQIEKFSYGHMKKIIMTKGLEKDELLIGLILSDAHITKQRTAFSNSQFQLTQTIKTKQMIDHVENYLNDIGFSTNRYNQIARDNGKIKSNDSINLSTLRYVDFTNLRKLWYPKGVKIVPKTIKLTPKSLAFWFMGDGSAEYRTRNSVRINLATNSFDLDSILHLSSELLELGIEKIRFYNDKRRDKNQYLIQITHSQDVIKFMKIIEPYVLDCFKYKIKFPLLNEGIKIG